MLDFVLFYLQLLFSTVGMLILCGLCVALLQKLFILLIGNTVGYRAILLTATVGTPIHELGHAVMCVLFGHTIEEISLYNPDPKNGMLGYVKHSYNPKNIYHQLGNFLIGLGPLLSGVGCMIGILFLCFNPAMHDYFDQAFAIVQADGHVWEICLAGLRLLPALFSHEGNLFLQILGLVLILAIMLHVNLSGEDIRRSLPGAGLYATLLLLFAAIVRWVGLDAVSTIQNGANIFMSYCIAVFMIIFVFSAVIISFSAILYLIRYWFVREK